MENLSTAKCLTILTEFSRNTNVDLGNTNVGVYEIPMWVYERAPFSSLSLLYDWKKAKQGGYDISVFAAVLTDLSKVFDCINQELLIAKLNAYGFDSPSLKFIYAYLNFREQNTKVDSTFSDYLNILYGIPQGSIAGQLFYNIYTCDMFFQIDSSDFSSYEDDNTFCFRIEPRKTNKFFPKHFKWYVWMISRKLF